MSIEALRIENNYIINEDTGERTALPEASIQLAELKPQPVDGGLIKRSVPCDVDGCTEMLVSDPDKGEGFWGDIHGTVPPPSRPDGKFGNGPWSHICLNCLRGKAGIEWMLRPQNDNYVFRNPLAAQLYEARRNGGEYTARQALAMVMGAEIASTKGSKKSLRYLHPITQRYEKFEGAWDRKRRIFVDLDQDSKDLLNEILDIMEPAPNTFNFSELNLDVFQQEGQPKVKQGSSGSKRDRKVAG